MAEAPIFDLTGRVALVTGASSGIGARFARLLAAAGAKVVLAARSTDKLEALRGEIVAAGGTAIAVGLDVTDEASTIAAYDAAEAAFGTVDSIIANAGLSMDAAAVDLTMDAFDQVHAVNLRGVFLTVREGGRRLLAAGSREKQNGRVVIISSITADVVGSGLAAYSATKAGVRQMGKVMAREWVRKGINVNMICPGYISTGMTEGWFGSEEGKRHMATFPRRRLGSESDLDVPLLFLASDSAIGTTGAFITVDDGQSL